MAGIKDILAGLGTQTLSAADAYYRRLRKELDPVYVQIRMRYQKLEPRERLLVRVAAALIGLFVIYDFVYLPIYNFSANLHSALHSRELELTQVQRMVSTYGRLKQELARAEKRTVPSSRDFSLFSVIQATLARNVGREKIVSITPSDTRISDELINYKVDLKLANVTLAQIVDALYGVQALSVPVRVTNLVIKRHEEQINSYDVDFTCAALGKNA